MNFDEICRVRILFLNKKCTQRKWVLSNHSYCFRSAFATTIRLQFHNDNNVIFGLKCVFCHFNWQCFFLFFLLKNTYNKKHMLIVHRITDELQVRENVCVNIWKSSATFSGPWGNTNEDIAAAYGQWTASIDVTKAPTYGIVCADGIPVNPFAENTHTFDALGSRQYDCVLEVQVDGHNYLVRVYWLHARGQINAKKN